MADQGMKAVQKSNFTETFQLFLQHEQLVKQDIAQKLGHSLPTVTTNLRRLRERDLIVAAGQLTGGLGRRATAYTLNPVAFLSIGMEMFGHHVTTVILSARGEILAVHRLDIVFDNSADYYRAVSEDLLAFVGQQDLPVERIIGLGIGVQGLVSGDGQAIVYGKILGNTSLTTHEFAQYLPWPVTFLHDADAVAVAEQTAAKREEDAIYLSIGEHLGTAMMINAQTYSGTNGRSGTMEHISIDAEHGRLCYCGRYGCIETYASISALLNDRDESIDAFFAEVQADEPTAVTRWASYLDHLAHAINNLHMFADTPIVLAGDLARFISEQTILDLHERILQLTAFPESEPYLRLGQVGQYAVATGAALPIMQRYVETI